MSNSLSDILNKKKIVLGVTGGIAAYKVCSLAREFIKCGAIVKVVMTPSATEFVTPLTFSSLTGNQVIVQSFPEKQLLGTNLGPWHIDLAIWADVIVVAPMTVNTLAKVANGFADNALTTFLSASRSPSVFVPAADLDMYNKLSTLENLEKIKKQGVYLVEAEKGFLASGLTGKGRMASLDKIIDATKFVLNGGKKDFENKNILITAGPTFEDIDSVRFIGNRSSGKMGFEIAKAAFLRGANVTLISGPSHQEPYQEIKLIKVRSAKEMLERVKEELEKNSILIKAAAVADYKPTNYINRKLKKSENITDIPIIKTEDILASINKKNKTVIGFALETDNELSNAKEKMRKKNLDMIILNSLNDVGAGFEFTTNKISVINKEDNKIDFPLASKFTVANSILSEIKKII